MKDFYWRCSNELPHTSGFHLDRSGGHLAFHVPLRLPHGKGPRAQDRILALDALYVSAMLLLLTFGMRTANTVYFEAALIIGMLGFVATVSLAKFLMRGEVIE